MSLIKLQGNASGTGAFTIAAPNGNTDRTLTLPDATGTVNVSGLANEVPAGSAGAPAIYPTGDSNTGVFFPAADTIAFAEGGVESMRIDSAGNVGIGTNSPASFAGTVKLVVGSAATTTTPGAVTVYSGTATYGGLYFADGTVGDQLYRGAIEYNHSTDALLLYSAGTERARIDASGNLLVATTAARAPITAVGAISSNRAITDGSAIAAAQGRCLYHVMIVSNYSTGNSVRSAAYYITMNNEGTAITNTTTVHNYNSQTASFSVSGGNIVVSGLSAGNNQCAVFMT